MNKKILIVEDEQDIANSLEMLLESENYHIEIALNGKAAIEVLLSEKFIPSLILLDLMMPIMNGLEFRQEQLKNQKYASIPVIIMSAHGHIFDFDNQLTANGYLKKPFEIVDLLNLINKLI